MPANGVYYFNLNVGAAAAYTTYFIDDVTLTSEPNTPYDNWMATAPVSFRAANKYQLAGELLSCCAGSWLSKQQFRAPLVPAHSPVLARRTLAHTQHPPPLTSP